MLSSIRDYKVGVPGDKFVCSERNHSMMTRMTSLGTYGCYALR